MTNTLSTNSNKELSSDFEFVESTQYVSKCQLHLSFESPPNPHIPLPHSPHYMRTILIHLFIYTRLLLSFPCRITFVCNFCFHFEENSFLIILFYLNGTLF